MLQHAVYMLTLKLLNNSDDEANAKRIKNNNL